MIFIDTNIFLRALTNDNKVQSPLCRRLLHKIEQGEIEAITTDLTVAEIVFILEGIPYSFTREKIAQALLPVVVLPALKNSSQTLWREIFKIYVNKTVDFIDAYNMVVMQTGSVTKAYSYDHDFDKAGLLKRLEP